jgi:hypothetical protein
MDATTSVPARMDWDLPRKTQAGSRWWSSVVAEVVGSHGALKIPVGMGHDGGAGAGSGVGAMEVAAAADTSTWPILVQDRR